MHCAVPGPGKQWDYWDWSQARKGTFIKHFLEVITLINLLQFLLTQDAAGEGSSQIHYNVKELRGS